MSDFSRREFLKIGAGTCAAFVVPQITGCDGEDAGGSEDTGDSEEAGGSATVYAISGDALSDLYTMALQATEKLGIKGSALTGATVFIKPNLVALGLSQFSPDVGECTKAEIIVGVAEQCLAAGAAKVTIGEGAQGMSWTWDSLPFFNGNTIYGGASDLLSAVDYLKSSYGDNKIELLNVNVADNWRYIPSSSDHELMKDGLMIAERFYEADHIISVPVIKTHEYGKITASMKNYVGIVPNEHLGTLGGIFRSKMHRAYLETPIAGVQETGVEGAFIDICDWRRSEGKEDFAVIDCSICLEGSGPHHESNILGMGKGTTIDIKKRNNAGKYFILASNDFLAADFTAAKIMNFNPFDVKQLVIAHSLNFGEGTNITYDGASLDDMLVPDWKSPVMSDIANVAYLKGNEGIRRPIHFGS
ncbi:MAG: DUF362 domain-containing protein [Myxococcota bacterium]|nr:DUF362 domain-containing protein [Myxococcota bacterium]